MAEEATFAEREKKYIEYGGTRCPFCQSEDIEGVDGPEADADGATQEIRCRACEKVWVDCYRLVGIFVRE